MMRWLPFALVLAASPAVAATLVVVEARGIALKPGSVLDDSKPLALKQGQHVTLISEAGATLKLDGPYNRPPAANADQGRSVAATLAAFTTERKARTGEAGVTRGTTNAVLPEPWLVDATHGGNACLLEGRDPVFWRLNAAKGASITVTPVDHSWKALAKWLPGNDRILVTPDVPMRTGETYSVVTNGEEFAITIILVPKALTSDAMRAAWMADKGCEAQARALLKQQ
jgi:hypothetical protein